MKGLLYRLGLIRIDGVTHTEHHEQVAFASGVDAGFEMGRKAGHREGYDQAWAEVRSTWDFNEQGQLLIPVEIQQQLFQNGYQAGYQRGAIDGMGVHAVPHVPKGKNDA